MWHNWYILPMIYSLCSVTMLHGLIPYIFLVTFLIAAISPMQNYNILSRTCDFIFNHRQRLRRKLPCMHWCRVVNHLKTLSCSSYPTPQFIRIGSLSTQNWAATCTIYLTCEDLEQLDLSKHAVNLWLASPSLDGVTQIHTLQAVWSLQSTWMLLCLWKWEESKALGHENPQWHKENMQTTHKED